MDTNTQNSKILNLNRIQTWLIIFGTGIGILTAVAAWAHGWLGLPDKVSHIDEAQRPLVELPARVANVEEQQKLLWNKIDSDHDLLITINQNLTDLKQDAKDRNK
jgi:hypothetical protein